MLFRRRQRQSTDAGAVAATAAATATPVLVVDDTNFFEATAGRITIVDFWAPWCGPCRTFAPIFAAAASADAGRATFGKCNIDESPDTAALLQIQSIPTLVVFGPDGSEVGRVVGALSRRQLDMVVDEVTATSA